MLLSDAEGALWTGEMIEVAQVAKPPALDRVVVAVDPVVSSGAGACFVWIVLSMVHHSWMRPFALILLYMSHRRSRMNWRGLKHLSRLCPLYACSWTYC